MATSPQTFMIYINFRKNQGGLHLALFDPCDSSGFTLKLNLTDFVSMNSNIRKNCANRHIYLHLWKHNIKEKSQVFFSSFLCNALLIQEFDSICMRCKYICLAPAVIHEPQRAKQHTPYTYFLDAQKEQDCNSVPNFCSRKSEREHARVWSQSHWVHLK